MNEIERIKILKATKGLPLWMKEAKIIERQKKPKGFDLLYISNRSELIIEEMYYNSLEKAKNSAIFNEHKPIWREIT